MSEDEAKTPRKMLAIMATTDDLDALRSIFEEMQNHDGEGQELAKRIMKAVHRCRKKHGFKWVG